MSSTSTPFPGFTVIISVYDGDRANWLKSALNSIVNQTAKPDEIVITRDGAINSTLQETIDTVITTNPDITFNVVGTEQNMGRGHVLAMGVEAAEHELIAIMDADDIALPHRFQQQLAKFTSSPEIDVIGSWIDEFEHQPDQPICVRKLPEQHTEIVSYAKWRNPINQMTVMFKRSAVLDVGNYQEAKYFEDMWLWYRMIHAGYQFYNIQETLVMARGGANIMARRTGLKYIKHETELLLKLKNAGYINTSGFALMAVTRLPIRLLPQKLARQFFVWVLRSNNKSS